MSYRLESPRPRSPLPPIRIRSSGYVPSSLGSPTTLLYDLPQSSSRSPPPTSTDVLLYSPPLKSPPLGSPTHGRQRARQTPPPRSRSATPAQVARTELDRFATYCHAWYFEQDEQAGELMTQTMEALSASQRAPFSRLQASIRSSYHTAMTRRRISEFRAHLSSTHPGASLLASSRANPYGKAAQKERLDRFSRFIRTWCTSGMLGTRPFFQGLWAILRLQILPVGLGGAGDRRIEWEFDDAVFQESALSGKEFMLEAIDVLKGVLGFEEYLPPRSPRLSHVISDEPQSPTLSTPITPKSPMTRPRSPSDPFLDTPALSHSVTTSTSRSTTTYSNAPPLPRSVSDDSSQASPDEIPERLQGISRSRIPYTPHKEPLDGDDDSLEGEPYMRVWKSPDLDNPELQSLLLLIPDFITRHTLPRFPIPQAKRRVPDLEEGLDIAGERKEVTCGTGRMWIGESQRREGWRGSWWHRFTGWWRRLFS
ncbi:hypothetical protein K439DRAFT_1615544 [Ramaria rubella]|nr:hypothetical protein K439DRAFT_1615544 [Ramaria rubella]